MKHHCFVLLIILFTSCKKDPEVVVDNTIPYYDKTPTVMVENYVNRLYIDLIGREPLDTEMTNDVDFLKVNELKDSARVILINKLQSSTNYIEGDSSYKHAYYHRIYEMIKVRLIEGASKAEINQIKSLLESNAKVDSIIGDMHGYQQKMFKANKLKALLDAEENYENGVIGIRELHAIMINNDVYDEINMNTFNFVNASFDNLLFRYPTQQEFYQSYDMIEYNLSRVLFGNAGQNKDDYINIITSDYGFYEGVIYWTYITLLARYPSDREINLLIGDFMNSENFQKIQEHILSSDEYANFN